MTNCSNCKYELNNQCRLNKLIVFDTNLHKSVIVYLNVKNEYLCKNWKENEKL